MTAYYNEIDPHAAQWLRNLIAAGLIAAGEVDERSIRDVAPGDLVGFTQCHFFAGVGIWSDALRRAGWPDERPVWTGSCPCQPFSSAGKGEGFADDRHLWPAWERLIRELHPGVVFGEQVSGKDGGAWLDLVQADMESLGYAFGPVVLPAAGFGAPHQRHRLFFVAESTDERHQRPRPAWDWRDGSANDGTAGGLADAERERGRRGESGREDAGDAGLPGEAGGMALADERGREESDVSVRPARQDEAAAIERGAGYWSATDWVPCADGAWRPVEPGTFPLAHGAPARVVRLRAYGNAIVAPVAEEFIRAYMTI